MPVIKRYRKTPNVFPLLHVRDHDKGGTVALISGRPGSGKTSFMVGLIDTIFKNKSADKIANVETVVWRGDPFCQWLRIPRRIPLKVWFRADMRPTFYQDGKVATASYEVFQSPDDFYSRAKASEVNVVYLPSYIAWHKFIKHTVYSLHGRWVSVFLDECEDLTEALAPYPKSRHVIELVEPIREARKQHVSLYLASQQLSDIDYRIRGKAMINVYLPGALLPRKSSERVYQQAIDALTLGQFYVSMGLYRKHSFASHPPPPENWFVEWVNGKLD